MSGLSVAVLTSPSAEAIIPACSGTCFWSCYLRYSRSVFVRYAVIAAPLAIVLRQLDVYEIGEMVEYPRFYSMTHPRK